MDGILSRKMANVLWGSKQSYKLGPAAIREVKAIIHSLQTEEWKIFISQMIPRDHHFESFGDASFIGGGAYSASLDYWFRVVWSKHIVAGTKLKPSDASYIHINVLECLVSFLQAVALVVTIESSALSAPIRDLFPNGIPAFPVLRCHTDTTATVSWVHDTWTTSPLAQALVALYGQLLKRSTLVCHTVHIPGDGNVLADWISRPNSLSHERLFLQTSQKYPWMNALRNFQPIDLAVGNTVKGKPIKAATIGNYLRDTATLLENFCGRDPRYTNRSDNELALPLRAVLNECKRHENMPHRVDPYTIEMHTTLVARNTATTAHMDGLHRAMEDWFNLSTYLGFRLREWAQEDDYRRLASGGEIAPNGTKRAFTLDDIRLFDSGTRPVSIAEFIENFDAVARSNVKFSWQKNHDHGEEKLLSSTPRNPSRDALRSLHNIVSRFARIVGLDKTDIPLAVYKGSFGEKFFIHSKVIASTLRTLAKKTYNLTDRDLQRHYKYTSHSLRAGAAVILHAAGINAIQIKFLLRWRSDSFSFTFAMLHTFRSNKTGQLTNMPRLLSLK
ncbi:unnamed protein product [Cylindrotheca closterium]|uniref:Tyr recombinase domain-containing protein n=1 Tax=Cylindrotheca closterium TaxID=2856 RepID=A0AAD2CNN4_9STRA|nr:unnamed protein product [Cylindrotheca closterium]